MNQTNKNVERQAIKQQKKQQQEEILTGIVDNESKTYTFEHEASINGGKKEKGTFTAKFMGVAARLRIGTLRAKLLEGAPAQSVDTITDDIAYMIAYLQVALIKTPAWWNYDALDDIEDLRAVYLEVFKFVQFFRGKNEQNTNVGDSTAAPSTENVETE